MKRATISDETSTTIGVALRVALQLAEERKDAVLIRLYSRALAEWDGQPMPPEPKRTREPAKPRKPVGHVPQWAIDMAMLPAGAKIPRQPR